jgi:hypothetical protein
MLLSSYAAPFDHRELRVNKQIVARRHDESSTIREPLAAPLPADGDARAEPCVALLG